MSIVESLLIVVGLSMNVFLIAQYEGTMIPCIEWFKILVFCLIFFAFQSLSMLAGYYLTMIPFFTGSSSKDLKNLCFFLAAILFLLVAAYMMYKAFKREIIVERAREIHYMRILTEALMVAVFTFMVGIGWGFIGHNNIFKATGIIACATIIAALSGIYTGYREGCICRSVIYGVGGAMLTFVGVDILVRYL